MVTSEFTLAGFGDAMDGDWDKSEDLELASTGKAIDRLDTTQRESNSVEFDTLAPET